MDVSIFYPLAFSLLLLLGIFFHRGLSIAIKVFTGLTVVLALLFLPPVYVWALDYNLLLQKEQVVNLLEAFHGGLPFILLLGLLFAFLSSSSRDSAMYLAVTSLVVLLAMGYSVVKTCCPIY